MCKACNNVLIPTKCWENVHAHRSGKDVGFCLRRATRNSWWGRKREMKDSEGVVMSVLIICRFSLWHYFTIKVSTLHCETDWGLGWNYSNAVYLSVFLSLFLFLQQNCESKNVDLQVKFHNYEILFFFLLGIFNLWKVKDPLVDRGDKARYLIQYDA